MFSHVNARMCDHAQMRKCANAQEALYRCFTQYYIKQWIISANNPVCAFQAWMGLLAVTARCHVNIHMNEATVRLASVNYGALFQQYNEALHRTLYGAPHKDSARARTAIIQHLITSPAWLRRHLYSLLVLPEALVTAPAASVVQSTSTTTPPPPGLHLASALEDVTDDAMLAASSSSALVVL